MKTLVLYDSQYGSTGQLSPVPANGDSWEAEKR